MVTQIEQAATLGNTGDIEDSKMNQNGRQRVPDFDLLVRQLVESVGLAGAAVRLGSSVRAVQYWMKRKHLPPLTKAEYLALRIGRRPSFMRLAIMQARANAKRGAR